MAFQGIQGLLRRKTRAINPSNAVSCNDVKALRGR
jgi:hypothetical protein